MIWFLDGILYVNVWIQDRIKKRNRTIQTTYPRRGMNFVVQWTFCEHTVWQTSMKQTKETQLPDDTSSRRNELCCPTNILWTCCLTNVNETNERNTTTWRHILAEEWTLLSNKRFVNMLFDKRRWNKWEKHNYMTTHLCGRKNFVVQWTLCELVVPQILRPWKKRMRIER